MPEIPWSNSEKQLLRRDKFVYNHSLSSQKQNLIGYIMPTSTKNSLKGEYNVVVPQMGNQRFNKVKKADPAGNISANQSGVASPRLRVGQPVLINFLGNKTQPIITHSFPFSGSEKEGNFGIDQKGEKGTIYRPAQNNMSSLFNGSGTIAPLIIRNQSQSQPEQSAAQVEVPGSYDIFTDDGKKYEFQTSNKIDINTDTTSIIEGKRDSIITRPLKVAQLQTERFPYDVQLQLDRFYRITNGEFLPEDLRKSQFGDEYKELFDPILERLTLLEEFIVGAGESVDTQIDWFEESLIQPAEDLFELWSDVINKGDILDLFGLESINFQVGLIPMLDEFFFDAIPSTGIGIVDAGINYGINWLKQQLIDEVLKGTLNLPSLEIGDFASIGLSLFGGGGSANPNLFRPDKGSIIKFKMPQILHEGSPVYETIKYGHQVNQSIKYKAKEIGTITSSLGSLVEGIAAFDLEGADTRRARREAIRDEVASFYDFEFAGDNQDAEVSILSSNDLPNIDDLILLNSETSVSGNFSIVKLEDKNNDYNILNHTDFNSSTRVVPVSPVSEANIEDDRELKLFSNNEPNNRLIPLISYDGDNFVEESVIISKPHTKTLKAFALSFTANTEESIVIETSKNENFNQIYESKDKHTKTDSSAKYDLYQQSFNFPEEQDYLYVRAKIGNLIFPRKEVNKPEANKNLFSYQQDYTTEITSVSNNKVEGTSRKPADSKVKDLYIKLTLKEGDEVLEESDLIKTQAGADFSYNFSTQITDSVSIVVNSYNPSIGEWSNNTLESSEDISFSKIEPFVDRGTESTLIEFELESVEELPDSFSVEAVIKNSNNKSFKDIERFQSRRLNSFSGAILIPESLPEDDYEIKLIFKSMNNYIESDWKNFMISQPQQDPEPDPEPNPDPSPEPDPEPNQFISVKDFGAVGDGVTDDTNAIQDAIDSINGQGDLYFPKGNYLVSETININGSIRLYGSGINVSTIFRKLPDSLNNTSQLSNGITFSGDYFSVENISFLSESDSIEVSDNITFSNGHGDSFINVNRFNIVYINNVSVKNWIGSGISLKAGVNKPNSLAKVENSYIENCGRPLDSPGQEYGDGIYARQIGKLVINNVHYTSTFYNENNEQFFTRGGFVYTNYSPPFKAKLYLNNCSAIRAHRSIHLEPIIYYCNIEQFYGETARNGLVTWGTEHSPTFIKLKDSIFKDCAIGDVSSPILTGSSNNLNLKVEGCLFNRIRSGILLENHNYSSPSNVIFSNLLIENDQEVTLIKNSYRDYINYFEIRNCDIPIASYNVFYIYNSYVYNSNLAKVEGDNTGDRDDREITFEKCSIGSDITNNPIVNTVMYGTLVFSECKFIINKTEESTDFFITNATKVHLVYPRFNLIGSGNIPTMRINNFASGRLIAKLDSTTDPQVKSILTKATGNILIEDIATVSAKNSVKDFGALGDGVTDDTGAIQKALDTIESNSTIFFPNGKYLIKDTLVVKNHTSLIGLEETQSEAEIIMDSNEEKVLITHQEGKRLPRKISNLKFGSKQDDFHIGILGDGYRFILDNCQFSSMKIGADLMGVFIRISDCYFASCNIGVYPSYDRLDNELFSTMFSFDRCTFNYGNYGLKQEARFNQGGSTENIINLSFSNCGFENQDYGIYVTERAWLMTVQNCWFENNSQHGLYMTEGDVVLTNNRNNPGNNSFVLPPSDGGQGYVSIQNGNVSSSKRVTASELKLGNYIISVDENGNLQTSVDS